MKTEYDNIRFYPDEDRDNKFTIYTKQKRYVGKIEWMGRKGKWYFSPCNKVSLEEMQNIVLFIKRRN